MIDGAAAELAKADADGIRQDPPRPRRAQDRLARADAAREADPGARQDVGADLRHRAARLEVLMAELRPSERARDAPPPCGEGLGVGVAQSATSPMKSLRSCAPAACEGPLPRVNHCASRAAILLARLRRHSLGAVLGFAALLAIGTAGAARSSRRPARRPEGQVRAADLRAQPCRQSCRRPPRSRSASACSRTRSCPRPAPSPAPSCHDPKLAFTDGESTGKGVTGKPLVRHTPTLWNVAWSPLLIWDGRASSLEDQVQLPRRAPRRDGLLARQRGGSLLAPRELRARVRASLPAGPADHARQHRQGARRLRAHAGVAADPLRPDGSPAMRRR